MRLLVIALTLVGLAIGTATVVHEGADQVLDVLRIGGWMLLWLAPLHVAAIGLDARGWQTLLPVSARPGIGYLTWAALIRESIDTLLPVARVGGGVAGMDLLCARGVTLPVSAASVLAELTITLISLALFVLIGFMILLVTRTSVPWLGWFVGGGVVLCIPLVFGLMYVQRQARVFRWLGRGLRYVFRARLSSAEKVERIDDELSRQFARYGSLALSSIWQLAGLLVTAVEVWFTLRIVGHPVSMGSAIVIESLGQALRSLAFIVPASLGVQEIGLIAFGSLVGLPPDVSLALSLAKRLRDVLVGLPSIGTWLWYQVRRIPRES